MNQDLQNPNLPDEDKWEQPTDIFFEMVAGEIMNDIDREIIEDLKRASETFKWEIYCGGRPPTKSS